MTTKKKKKAPAEPEPEVVSNEPEEETGDVEETEETEEEEHFDGTIKTLPPGHDPEEVLDPEKHVAIHLGGEVHKIMLLSEFPGVRPYSRTLNLNGQTVEHTHDHRGVWAYRHLG